MFCPHCGKPAEAEVRFCANCGVPIGAQTGAQAANANYPQPASRINPLIRPRYPRMIAGVCAAFALQYGWDLSLVRILTVVFALITSGFGGLCYLAAWVIIPEGAYALPSGASVGYPPTTASTPGTKDSPTI